jgi:hypothetical protein
MAALDVRVVIDLDALRARRETEYIRDAIEQFGLGAALVFKLIFV